MQNPYEITPQDYVDAASDDRSFSLLPVGLYTCVVTKAEERATKDGTGMYLALEITIDDGPHKGRKVWDNINIVNKSPQAQAIARKSYTALCAGIGKPRGVASPSELCFQRFVAKVGIQAPQNGYEERNKIAMYVMPEGAGPGAISAPPVATPRQSYSAPSVSDGGWTV